jgi:hypothetical protein
VRKLYFTLEELAARWRCSERALRGRIARGTLEATRFPGSRPWLVHAEVVAELERGAADREGSAS